MSDPMAEIKASFFIECEELLEALQDALQVVTDGEADDETTNVMFRAVHSIKGGAGAFGLAQLVEFSHCFETVLDELRCGRLAMDAALVQLFFECGDVMSDLVRECRDESDHDLSRVTPMLTQLEKYIDTPEAEEEVDFQPMGLSLDLPDIGVDETEGEASEPTEPSAQESEFIVHFRPEQMLYTHGNEPLFLFKALQEYGQLDVHCNDSTIPTLEELDPEVGYLEWKISVRTESPVSLLFEVFEFVEGICSLDIASVEAQIAAPETPEAPDLPLPIVDPDTSDLPLPIVEPDAPTPDLVEVPAAPKPFNSQNSGDKPKNIPPVRATVRVDLERVDRLVNLVGELVINQAMISQCFSETNLPAHSFLETRLEEFLQLTRDLQDSVMMIRAQPVKSLFQRMGRIVREASADAGKTVKLTTSGDNTEIDKTVIERLADPLTHMIRNAVDHGLETCPERESQGKPAKGAIKLSAAHRSGRVVIEVSDDGDGIDRQKVHQIAVKKELIQPDQQLTDSEIDNLLFLPGFSTAEQVSNLSGRGVGMDVVRSAIQALGGRIAISSQRGVGTTFTISLPLTLAVLDGMIVRVADETLVVPLNSILETQTLTSNDIRSLGAEANVVNIRQKFVPMLDLGVELAFRGPLPTYAGCVMLLIENEDGSRAALIVDSILDQRQVVIKGFQDSYERVSGIAAATILGNGQIALIVDPVDLLVTSDGRTRAKSTHSTDARENHG